MRTSGNAYYQVTYPRYHDMEEEQKENIGYANKILELAKEGWRRDEIISKLRLGKRRYDKALTCLSYKEKKIYTHCINKKPLSKKAFREKMLKMQKNKKS